VKAYELARRAGWLNRIRGLPPAQTAHAAAIQAARSTQPRRPLCGLPPPSTQQSSRNRRWHASLGSRPGARKRRERSTATAATPFPPRWPLSMFPPMSRQPLAKGTRSVRTGAQPILGLARSRKMCLSTRLHPPGGCRPAFLRRGRRRRSTPSTVPSPCCAGITMRLAALTALDAYLDRYPHGVLHREARLARLDALLILKRTDEALAELETLPLDSGRRSS
jgi:hypothetical protein